MRSVSSLLYPVASEVFRASLVVAGGLSAEDTPVPISNTVVKLCRADGTAGGIRWESTSPPASSLGPPFGVGPSFLCWFGVSGAVISHCLSRRPGGDPRESRWASVARPSRPVGSRLAPDDQSTSLELAHLFLGTPLLNKNIFSFDKPPHFARGAEPGWAACGPAQPSLRSPIRRVQRPGESGGGQRDPASWNGQSDGMSSSA